MSRERGATMVEAALALTVLVLFIMGAMQISVFLMRQATLDHVVSIVHRRVAMDPTPANRRLVNVQQEIRNEAGRFGIPVTFTGPNASVVQVCRVDAPAGQTQIDPQTLRCTVNNVEGGQPTLGTNTGIGQIQITQPSFLGFELRARSVIRNERGLSF